MPGRIFGGGGQQAPGPQAPASRQRRSIFQPAGDEATTLPVIEATEAPPADEGITGGDVAAAGAGAAALGGLGWLASKMPGRIGKAAQGLNALRQQLMLSGLAVPKSFLGNVGAGIEQAAEGKGFGALKEILSMQTAKDAVRAMKSPTALVNNPAGQGAANLPGVLSIPGRIMGGFDEATRNALQRAGLGAKEAENAVLQSPLTGSVAEAFEGPAMQYLFPFRRTPFNQFIEGAKRLPGGAEGSTRAKVIYGAAGAAHGAATSDDQFPASVAIATALASRYGMPYAAAALIARKLAGGSGAANIASSALPVSEYGFSQGLQEPFAGFEPAAYRALKRAIGED